MHRIKTAVVVALASSFAIAAGVTSPDGRNAVKFDVDEAGRPVYSFSYHGMSVIEPSTLGFEIKTKHAPGPRKPASLLDGFEIAGVETSPATSETWKPVWGEEAEITDTHTEMLVSLKQRETDRLLNIRFRVFDDGLGFRYEFPEQKNLDHFTIVEERTFFNLPCDATAWWIPADYDTQEYRYTKSHVSEIPAKYLDAVDGNLSSCIPATPAVQTALMMKYDGQGVRGTQPPVLWVNLHEAACVDYATMHLEAAGCGFVSHLTPDASGAKGWMQCPCVTPWRTVIAGETGADILASRITLNLNEPCAIEDVSWIHPVKYLGVWWTMITGAQKWAYMPNPAKHAANTANVRRYIDFAAEHGFDEVLVEGWNTGFEDWFGCEKDEVFDFTTPYPDFDLEGLNAYAHGKGVKLMMYHETSASTRNYERRLDAAYALMLKYGYDTVKSGYVGNILPHGEHHYSQWMNNHYLYCVKEAAKRRIMVNQHEAVRPTGLCRTWPNLIGNEAARGTEYEAFGGNNPEHTTILPFTRLVGGPMDYTPGIFEWDLSKACSWQKGRLSSTLCGQLALYVTLFSPLQMAADLPENYATRLDAFQFIKDVPCDWERSVYLEAEPGEVVTIARKDKKSADWFLGSKNGLAVKRESRIACSFLEPGAEYEATIYRDADDAVLRTATADRYKIETQLVTCGSVLSLASAPGGGFAIRFRKLESGDAMSRARQRLAALSLDEKCLLAAGSGTMTLKIPGEEREWRMSDSSHTVRGYLDRWTFDAADDTPTATVLPTLCALAATWNKDLAAVYGHVVGAEARARGVDQMLGPGVNIMRNPLCGRNWEYLSEDPCLAAKIIVPEIKALQLHGVAATVKHFCLNGQELNRFGVDTICDERTLHEIYLPAFEAAVKDAGVLAVMTAYNKVNGEWCSENAHLQKDILRGEFGFKGMIVTDWGGQHSTVKAALAGAGVEMNEGRGIRYFVNPKEGTMPLADAVRSGELPESIVDDIALRSLYVVEKARENDLSQAFYKGAEWARKIGDEAVVLLKNDAAVLPFDKAKTKKVVVFGKLATTEVCRKGWSCEGNPEYEITPLQGLEEYFSIDRFFDFSNDSCAGKENRKIENSKNRKIVHLPLAAVKDAENARRETVDADAVIVFTGTEIGHGRAQECEGGDRPDMRLADGDDDAIAEILSWNLPNVAIVVRSGSALELPWADDAKTLVWAPYLGQESGRIIADVLFGDANPSGKLPFSWPRRYEDTAVAQAGTYSSERSELNEGMLVGYRWHDAKGIAPLFPFGYGLSYSTFKYSNLAVDGMAVSVDVTNTGAAKGKEVVQLYVQDEMRALKDFTKIELAPGETKRVAFTLTDRDLSFWDVTTHSWRRSPGPFKVFVGPLTSGL